MNWRHTHVWEINHQLVVADTVEEAISIYRMYSERGILSEPITIQQIGNSDAIGKDYSAIMREIPPFATEPGTYIKDYERNPKPVPTEKPIDIMDIPNVTFKQTPTKVDIVPAPSSADVNWSTNDTQSTSTLTGKEAFYGD